MKELLEWHPHPDVWAAVVALGVAYGVAIRTWGTRHRPVDGTQIASFVAGLVILLIAADWPLHDLAEESSFAAHMVQHLVFMFVAPPLLLLGIPQWLWRKLLSGRGGAIGWGAVRFFTRPLVALLLFNATMAVTHWPALVNLSIRSDPVHLFIHVAVVSTAVLMWWPVVAPLPELSSLTEPAKMFYLFLQSVLPTVPASFLTFSSAPVYSAYEGLPHLFGMSAHVDQQVAGLIMKIGGGLLLWATIAYLFFRWHSREEAGEIAEVPWEDFEGELEAWDMRR